MLFYKMLILVVEGCYNKSEYHSVGYPNKFMGMRVRFELFVSDTKCSVDFYSNILGFEEVRTDIEGDYHQMKKDDVYIGIGPFKKLRNGHYFRPEVLTERKGLGVEIVLEVDDIEELYNKVRSNGYPIETKLGKREWGLVDFRIVDPDGYYLRPTSRYEKRLS